MKKYFLLLLIGLLPIIAFAQAEGLKTLVLSFGRLINLALPIVVSLAVLIFFWGLAKYLLSTGDKTKLSEGRNMMVFGILALFVMVSVWGIVKFFQQNLNITDSSKVLQKKY